MNTEREKVREQKIKETCMGGGGRERGGFRKRDILGELPHIGHKSDNGSKIV
jgi:hypothetical protein